MSWIREHHPVVISANFVPDSLPADYAFFSNNKRFDKIEEFGCKTIITSNLLSNSRQKSADFVVDYNHLSGAFAQGCNSLVMLLKLLKILDVDKVALAGADGFTEGRKNYYSSDYKSHLEYGSKYNTAVADAIRNIGIGIRFITPSAYEK